MSTSAAWRRCGGDDAPDEDSDLKLTVMLLRGENARLKAARHDPSDVDTLIDGMRRLGAEKGGAEMIDEAWTLLSECLLIREGLEQACAEIQAAIGAVQGTAPAAGGAAGRCCAQRSGAGHGVG
ncbi:MAG: hypothetical protein ACLP01_18680 [Solirubrobacteraceae bacterium]